MQKNTLNRARLDNDDFDEKYLKNFNKDKSLKTRILKFNITSKKSDKFTRI